MIKHTRIITLDGDPSWILTTLKNSLPEGKHTGMFGEYPNKHRQRSITIKHIDEFNEKDVKLKKNNQYRLFYANNGSWYAIPKDKYVHDVYEYQYSIKNNPSMRDFYEKNCEDWILVDLSTIFFSL